MTNYKQPRTSRRFFINSYALMFWLIYHKLTDELKIYILQFI